MAKVISCWALTFVTVGLGSRFGDIWWYIWPPLNLQVLQLVT